MTTPPDRPPSPTAFHFDANIGAWRWHSPLGAVLITYTGQHYSARIGRTVIATGPDPAGTMAAARQYVTDHPQEHP